jgi:hypothetical protein
MPVSLRSAAASGLLSPTAIALDAIDELQRSGPCSHRLISKCVPRLGPASATGCSMTLTIRVFGTCALIWFENSFSGR